MKHYIACLSIAGSDPSGGAGIQADLKTFSSLGCYGAAAITAITVQNTQGVKYAVPLDAQLVYDQAATVMEDLPIKALKIGMTANADIVRSITRLLRTHPSPFTILDPVMVSSSGETLINGEAINSILDELAPLCTLITPNIPELLKLTGSSDAEIGGRKLIKISHSPHILVKGGHLAESPNDTLISAEQISLHFPGKRISTINTHGTGCTLSSAITAFLARGYSLPAAIASAKNYIEEALRHGADIKAGNGSGAMNHFFNPSASIIEDL